MNRSIKFGVAAMGLVLAVGLANAVLAQYPGGGGGGPPVGGSKACGAAKPFCGSLACVGGYQSGLCPQAANGGYPPYNYVTQTGVNASFCDADQFAPCVNGSATYKCVTNRYYSVNGGAGACAPANWACATTNTVSGCF
jgi:hypothetical protein